MGWADANTGVGLGNADTAQSVRNVGGVHGIGRLPGVRRARENHRAPGGPDENPDSCCPARGRAAHRRPFHRRVLATAARDEPHGHHPAHHQTERRLGRGRRCRHQPREQLPEGGAHTRWRVSGPALQRHRRLQDHRSRVVLARRPSRSGARPAGRRAHRDRRGRAGARRVPLHAAHRRSDESAAGRRARALVVPAHESRAVRPGPHDTKRPSRTFRRPASARS